MYIYIFFFLVDCQDCQGNWDGLIRELLQGHADMSVTSLLISEDRSRAVSFSEPYLETGITIIVAIREGAISATAFLGWSPCSLKTLKLIPPLRLTLGTAGARVRRAACNLSLYP